MPSRRNCYSGTRNYTSGPLLLGMEEGPYQGSTHHWGLRPCILEAGTFPMEAVVSSRGLGNLLHDALRLHVLLSPCIDGHMGSLEQKQHLIYKLCKLRREQAKLLSVHIAKASTAHKTSVRRHQGPALPQLSMLQSSVAVQQMLRHLPSIQRKLTPS